MTALRCKKCAKLFRSIPEIIDHGGEVYQLGLALMARCACGETWPCGQLWKRTELINLPYLETGKEEEPRHTTRINAAQVYSGP